MNAFGEPTSVLVLGGTSDIALATARRLAARGAERVVLAGRDLAALKSAASAVGHRASTETVEFDAVRTERHGEVLDAVFDRGDIDTVLLAFGVLPDQEVAVTDPAVAVTTAQVNYTGAMSAALHVARRFRAQGHGTLVVFSSVAAERARRSNFVYGSSKAGLDLFAQGLGVALEGTGCRVMIVRPGFVRTKMTHGRRPAPFSTDPESVAEALLLGLQRRSRIVWIPSALRWVMTVVRHLPYAVARRFPL
jgi:decaprenylphospho-beta-D-erythro-pentofuranosid-2-ulose 2-reductase